MRLHIHQSIVINSIRIEGLTNSSVFQIGTTGQIQALSNLYNTGGYTEPAPLPGEIAQEPPFVPLQPPAP
ncbi:spore gernimation protein [Bacillaceae bacterium SIJ1]|uniref:spore germination protein GerPB n=1 Tax=Litoribacterium kuwaitense TaxID=1398745 RepID=UPI0013EC8175|nr:spore germination protein GerPB [Litoribacterium kuwaitense]NGP44519.1 spore gernimation protein [Litoribacterium kuwaitense]